MKKSIVYDNGISKILEMPIRDLVVYAIERTSALIIPVLLLDKGLWVSLTPEMEPVTSYLNSTGGLRGPSSSTRGRVLAAVATYRPENENTIVEKATALLRDRVEKSVNLQLVDKNAKT